MNRSVTLMLASSGMAFLMAAHAQTTDQVRTLRVANNGVDSTSCGGSTRPCRSISQAIANARDGDSVLVGPGHYGDANGDGDFDDSGDEHGNVGQCGGTTSAMICVNKRLALSSTNGADVTVIDAAHIDMGGGDYAVVSIASNGVTFGRKAKGFTFANAPRGLEVLDFVSNVRVAGNTARGNGLGFSIAGEDEVRIRDNVATNSKGFGGFLVRSFGSGTIFLSNNAAIDNDLVAGFLLVGPGRQVIRSNIASGNFVGFLIDNEDGEGMVVQFNTASNNETGFNLQGSGHLFRNNLAVGNRGEGIAFVPDSGEIEVHANNIFGNTGLGSTAVAGCGLTNQSGHEIDARNNFWGAASGPGPDPADDAGGVCDTSVNSVTIVRPFAREAFPVSP